MEAGPLENIQMENASVDNQRHLNMFSLSATYTGQRKKVYKTYQTLEKQPSV